jgi:hypothetical protein
MEVKSNGGYNWEKNWYEQDIPGKWKCDSGDVD